MIAADLALRGESQGVAGWRWGLQVAALAALYVGTGTLGMSLAYVGSHVTLVWPPTGIAIAALVRLGPRIWPGIWLGAAAVNLIEGAEPLLASGIATTNTLGPLLAAALLRRWRFECALERRRDVFAYAVAVAVAMLVPPTGGVLWQLVLAGLPPVDAARAWVLWWLGDTVGALLVGPVLLMPLRLSAHAARGRGLELLVLLALAVLLGVDIFLLNDRPLTFLLLIPLIWGALRFPGWASNGVVMSLAILAIAGTSTGSGPFVATDAVSGLLLLSTFLATVALLNLVLGALLAERQAADRALSEQVARNAGIVDSAMDGIITVDAEQRIVVFNAAAEAIFRCPAAEAVGAPLERFIPERHRAAHRAHVRRFGNSPVVTRTMGGFREIHGLRADGEEFPLEASISQIEVGGAKLFTATLRDVTERRHADEVRCALEAQLVHAQKMEAVGTLAGGIAHDFNNLLAAIMLNAELLAHRGGSEELASIQTAAGRGRDLVRQILAFSRKQESQRGDVEVGAIVAEAMSLLRASIPATVEVEVDVSAGDHLVEADASQLHQVLMNLGTNALHAMIDRPGRLRVSVDTVQETSGAAAARRRGWVRVSVADDGTGMPPATVERIFEPFFTTKHPGQGSGLGLSVVHGIVAAHGGAIRVDSEPGKGTTIHVLLPVSTRGAGAGGEPVHDVGVARGEHVVLVDDEATLVRASVSGLELLGYRVSGFTSPLDALAAVQSAPQSFDAVITDLTMPAMTGTALADALVRVRPGMPIILTTGYGGAIDAELARTMGICEVVAKPSTAEALAAALRRALDSSASAA